MPSGKFSFWETKASTDDRPIGPLGAASKPKSGSRSGRSKPEPETSTGRQSLKARSQSKTGRKERTKSQHRTDSGLSKRSASKPRPPLPRIAVPPQQITQIQQETNSVVSNDSEKTDPMSLLHGTATNVSKSVTDEKTRQSEFEQKMRGTIRQKSPDLRNNRSSSPTNLTNLQKNLHQPISQNSLIQDTSLSMNPTLSIQQQINNKITSAKLQAVPPPTPKFDIIESKEDKSIMSDPYGNKIIVKKQKVKPISNLEKPPSMPGPPPDSSLNPLSPTGSTMAKFKGKKNKLSSRASVFSDNESMCGAPVGPMGPVSVNPVKIKRVKHKSGDSKTSKNSNQSEKDRSKQKELELEKQRIEREALETIEKQKMIEEIQMLERQQQEEFEQQQREQQKLDQTKQDILHKYQFEKYHFDKQISEQQKSEQQQILNFGEKTEEIPVAVIKSEPKPVSPDIFYENLRILNSMNINEPLSLKEFQQYAEFEDPQASENAYTTGDHCWLIEPNGAYSSAHKRPVPHPNVPDTKISLVRDFTPTQAINVDEELVETSNPKNLDFISDMSNLRHLNETSLIHLVRSRAEQVLNGTWVAGRQHLNCLNLPVNRKRKNSENSAHFDAGDQEIVNIDSWLENMLTNLSMESSSKPIALLYLGVQCSERQKLIDSTLTQLAQRISGTEQQKIPKISENQVINQNSKNQAVNKSSDVIPILTASQKLLNLFSDTVVGNDSRAIRTWHVILDSSKKPSSIQVHNSFIDLSFAAYGFQEMDYQIFASLLNTSQDSVLHEIGKYLKIGMGGSES